jgi:hypothetical protein
LLDKFIKIVIEEKLHLKNFYFTPEMIVLTKDKVLKINTAHMVAEFMFPPNALRRRFFRRIRGDISNQDIQREMLVESRNQIIAFFEEFITNEIVNISK